MSWIDELMQGRFAGYKVVETDWIEIITPFLNIHNDHIALFVERQGDKIIITDDQSTDNLLFTAGIITLNEVEEMTLPLTTKGITMPVCAATMKTTAEKFPFAFQQFIQGIIGVNALLELKLRT